MWICLIFKKSTGKTFGCQLFKTTWEFLVYLNWIIWVKIFLFLEKYLVTHHFPLDICKNCNKNLYIQKYYCWKLCRSCMCAIFTIQYYNVEVKFPHKICKHIYNALHWIQKRCKRKLCIVIFSLLSMTIWKENKWFDIYAYYYFNISLLCWYKYILSIIQTYISRTQIE